VNRPFPQDDAAEAARLLERQRREVERAGTEAEERRRRAVAHAAGPMDPRAQGLWDAAAFHAERARGAAARLAIMERQAAVIRLGAAARRRAAEAPSTERPCE
jgi:hypothetical protein